MMAFIVLMPLQSIGVLADKTTASSVWTTAEKLGYSGGSVSFTAIHVNLNNPKVQLEISTAENSIGKVDSLPNLVKGVNDEDGEGVAGINGTFFNAYSDLQPLGTIIQKGSVEHISNTGSVFGVSAKNQVFFDPAYIAISGGTSGEWEWPYNWYSWSINHFYANESATMIFNSEYKGIKPQHTFTVVTVSGGLVSKIDQGSFTIPSDGYLVLSKDKNLLSKFKVGIPADYRFDYFKNNYSNEAKTVPLPAWESMRTAVGAGPTLVKGGKVVVNPQKEGFTEAKILTNKGQRSFIGVTKQNELIMASVPNVSVTQLAEIAVKMKCTEAINLDGGASSGTYANGKTLVATGRNVSNALVVKVLNEEPIYYRLNDRYFFIENAPYWDSKSQKVYVPIRSLDVYLNGNKTLPKILALSDRSFTRNKETYVSLTDATALLGVEGIWNKEGRTVEFKKTEKNE